MSWIVENLWLIPALPLVAAGVTALVKRPRRGLAASLAILSMGVSFLLSLCAFAHTLFTQRDAFGVTQLTMWTAGPR